MQFAETCPDCGAGRPSWLGSSHHTHDYFAKRFHIRICEDGKTPDDLFAPFEHGREIP